MRIRLRDAGVFALDLATAGASFHAAYQLSYANVPVADVPGFYDKLTAFTLVSGACLLAFKVTRASWRHVGLPDLVSIVKACLIAVAIYTVGVFLVSRGTNVPRSVPILAVFFMIGGLSGMRVFYRLLVEGSIDALWLGSGAPRTRDKIVLVLGLTQTAENFIRVSKRRNGNANFIAGLFDEDPINHFRLVHGIKVFGGIDKLGVVCLRLRRAGTDVSELVVAETRPSPKRLSELLKLASEVGLKVSRLPDPETSFVTSNTLVSPRPIELGDLLGRPELVTDVGGVAQLVNGRVVLVTGAGGSIGSELCRQIVSYAPARLVIADGSEYNLYVLDKEIRGSHPDLDIVTRLVDVRDRKRVFGVFADMRPDVVFHAAALKHVPLVEENPIEGVKTNVFGTRNVADAALEYAASAFVMISTDKAVNPTNVMGATKRAAEAYCQALDITSDRTRFKTVRFGNVLGSNGSVVPHFREQIAAGGPITVTHPNIVRYFMTIPEAVRLVLHSSSHALKTRTDRGRIMVLDMGQPVKIVDLAERMIQLAGYRPGIDIEIKFTGLRPGEKLYEELFDRDEVQDEVTSDGFVVAFPRVIDKALLFRTLERLEHALAQEDRSRTVELLTHIVPEFRRSSHLDLGHSSAVTKIDVN